MIDHSIFGIHVDGDVHILQISVSDLSDREIVRALEEGLGEYLKQHQPGKFVLDFVEVRFLTSEMLSVLLRLREQVREWHGAVRLANLSGSVREVFRVTKLEQIFAIDHGVDESRSAFDHEADGSSAA